MLNTIEGYWTIYIILILNVFWLLGSPLNAFLVLDRPFFWVGVPWCILSDGAQHSISVQCWAPYLKRVMVPLPPQEAKTSRFWGRKCALPQSTLGHLAPQKSQGFTGTFHPKDLRFERQRLRDLRTLASSWPEHGTSKQKQLPAKHKHWQRECAFSFLPANPSVGWYLVHVWKLFILAQHIWNSSDGSRE